jgi:hypothetical protein
MSWYTPTAGPSFFIDRCNPCGSSPVRDRLGAPQYSFADGDLTVFVYGYDIATTFTAESVALPAP